MCEKGKNGINDVKTGISGGALHAEEARTIVSGTEKITFGSGTDDDEGIVCRCDLCGNFEDEEMIVEDERLVTVRGCCDLPPRTKIEFKVPLTGENECADFKPKAGIRCAAIKAKSGKIYEGLTHADCFNKMQDDGDPDGRAALQGFVTDAGEFVNRKDAAQIAFEAGQIDKPLQALFSENLRSRKLEPVVQVGYVRPSCGECRFFCPDVVDRKGNKIAAADVVRGSCRLNPPVFVVKKTSSEVPFSGVKSEHVCQVWPDMNVDEWCGRFEPKAAVRQLRAGEFIQVDRCHGVGVASEDIKAGRAVCFGDDGKVVNAVKDVAGEIDALRDKALRVNGYSAGDLQEHWEGLTRKELKVLREMSRRYAGGDDVFNKELAELVIGTVEVEDTEGTNEC